MIKIIFVTLLIGGVILSIVEALEIKCNRMIDNMEIKRSEKLMKEIEESGV